MNENEGEVVTPAVEDDRLFVHKGVMAGKLRLNTWYPFAEKYWPYLQGGGDHPNSVISGYSATLLMLERYYDNTEGRFRHMLVHLSYIEKDIHPNKTRRFLGFMLVSPESAMAALLIPMEAENPID